MLGADTGKTQKEMGFLQAGEVILLHNLTLHRSGVNRTSNPRRAISVAYVDASSGYLEGDAAVGSGSAGPRGDGARAHGASAMVDGQFPVVWRLEGSSGRHKL